MTLNEEANIYRGQSDVCQGILKAIGGKLKQKPIIGETNQIYNSQSSSHTEIDLNKDAYKID